MVQFNCIEKRLASLFFKYGKLVHRCPAPFIAIPILVTCSLACCVVWKLDVLKDDISLYTPDDGRSKAEKASLKRYFDINDSDPYFAERRFDSKRTGFIIVVSKVGESTTDRVVFEQVKDLWKLVSTFTVEHDKKWYDYDKLCVRVPHGGGSCVRNPLLDMFEVNPLSLLAINYPLTGQGVFLGNVLGGVVLNNRSVVARAEAVLLPYQLKFSSPENDLLAEKWETALTTLLSTYENEHVDVHWWTSETLASESYRDMQILLKLLAPLFVLVTLFTVGCCFVKSWLRSKPWLGLCGVGSAAFAIVSSIGLCLLSGEKLTSVSYFMPFVIFSIGVDNVFILIAAWRKTNIYFPVSERMAGSLREAGVSITVTSLTDILSFGVGCSSNFPSVKNFCLYAAVAVSFVYIYQLTFFAGCMVVSGSKEDASRNCLSLKSIAYQHRVKMWNTDTSIKPLSREERVDNHVLARFFRGSYTNFLMNPMTKGVVLISTLIYIGLAVWGCTKIKVGLEPIDLLPKSSYARTTLTLTDRLFTDYGDYMHLWFTNLTALNYDSRFWLILDREVRRFENTSYSEFGDSWLRAFVVFARSAGLTITPENFLLLLKDTFLKKPFYEKYARDVIFSNNESSLSGADRLDAVRFLIRLRRIDFDKRNEMVRYFRQLADESPLSALVYNDFFPFVDQFDAITPSILTNIGQASAAVVLASLLLIPKPLCSIWVCATIASINVGIFGYMAWWGVNLDFVSMVTITMSVGFSVDFSAHIAYHFAKESGLSAVARIRDSVYVVGTPILQSAVSTLLGVLVLVIVDNYVFRSFLKTSFLIVVLGVVHGLVILPVLLTIFYCDTETSTDYGDGSSADNMIKTTTSENYSNSTRKTSLATTTAVYSFPVEAAAAAGYDPHKFAKYWDRINRLEAELAKQRNLRLALSGGDQQNPHNNQRKHYYKQPIQNIAATQKAIAQQPRNPWHLY